jgi:hypothetical protein
MAQLAPAARVLPQLFVSAKPNCVEIPMFEICMAVPPVFDSVTVRADVVVFMFSWPNERLDGVNVTVWGRPVPVRPTLWGLPLALSVTASDAVRVPDADGVNVTYMKQLLPSEKLPSQLFVSAKSAEFAPLMLTLEMFSVPFPEFTRLTNCGALVLPVYCWLNVRLEGERVTAGDTPNPVRFTLCGLPLALSVTVSDAVRVPDADGVNDTLIVQLFPASRLPPQLFA